MPTVAARYRCEPACGSGDVRAAVSDHFLVEPIKVRRLDIEARDEAGVLRIVRVVEEEEVRTTVDRWAGLILLAVIAAIVVLALVAGYVWLIFTSGD